jgi:undecaprenyl-diphosphatase
VNAGWLDVILLAVVQGLTEFLPISSSGHLVLAEHLLGVDEPGVALEIVLHLGTLLAVTLYYRDDLWSLVTGGWRWLRGQRGPEEKTARLMIGWLVLGTVPAAVGGVLLGDAVESAFSDPQFVCGALVFTGLLLLSTRLRRPGRNALSTWRSCLVGVWQMLALFPGVSRSGSTISGGLHLRLRPEEAARFSFLLSVPVILGATVLKAPELGQAMSSGRAAHYLVGLLVSFVLGYASIGVLLRVVRRGRFGWFGVYCLVVGVGGLVWFALGG